MKQVLAAHVSERQRAVSKKLHSVRSDEWSKSSKVPLQVRVNASASEDLSSNTGNAETEAAEPDKGLQILSRRLLHVQEEERRSIARELHDGLNQTLAKLGVEVGIALIRTPPSATLLRRLLQRIRIGVEELSNEVRQISHRLHPAVLEHFGLPAALRRYCSEFEEYRNINVAFACEDSFDRLSYQVAVSLYRIVQEALSNAAKHANAREVIVTLSQTNGEIRLSIEDDGCGFDVIKPNQSSGLGLISIEERTRLVGGRLSIDSQIGSGARIEVVVPAGKE
jgi:signal transduction histidine kinase